MPRGRTPRVSNLDCALIVGQIQSGSSTRTVALRFHIANSSVNRIYHKYLETQDVKDRPGSNMGVLRTLVLEEWNNLPIANINRIIPSMNKRARQVVEHQGGYTDY